MNFFPSANFKCISHCIKPTTDKKPEQVILHCGTNNLVKDTTEKIVSDYVHENIPFVTVSAIVPRRGGLHLHKAGLG